MTRGLDEVEACVHAVVDNFLPVYTVLLFQVRVEPGFNVLDNRFPASSWVVRSEE